MVKLILKTILWSCLAALVLVACSNDADEPDRSQTAADPGDAARGR